MVELPTVSINSHLEKIVRMYFEVKFYLKYSKYIENIIELQTTKYFFVWYEMQLQNTSSVIQLRISITCISITIGYNTEYSHFALQHS
jgi:hypothetical protein